jgi:lipid-A-disaccharide synthase-like uncharacterized protein
VKGRLLIVAAVVLIAVVAGAVILFRGRFESSFRDEAGIRIKVKLENAAGNPRLVRLEDGSFRYELEMRDGGRQSLTPQEFSQQLYAEQSSRNIWWRLMNITSPLGIAWVSLGLLGQVLFTGRMVVQWLVSERRRRSVVPVAFWWMSLLGATMLLTYFLWRKDVVGVLGQATGWFIYVRNLWLIYGRTIRRRIAADPGPGPGLPPSLSANDGHAAD